VGRLQLEAVGGEVLRVRTLVRNGLEYLLDLKQGVRLVRRAHLRLHPWPVLPDSVTSP